MRGDGNDFKTGKISADPKKSMLTSIPSYANRALPPVLVLAIGAFPLSNALANLSMLLACLLWLVAGRYTERWEVIRHNVGLWAALGLYAWMWVGISYTTASSDDIQQHLVKYFKLAFMVVVVTGLQDVKWQRRAWLAFGASMGFVLLSTYLNIWLQLPWSRTQNQGWNVDHTVVKDYISQGIQMSLFVALMLGSLIRKHQSRARQLLWLILAVAAAVSITHLSAGRTGYLALGASLAGFAFWASSRWTWRIGSLLLLVVGAVGVYAVSPQMQDRISQTLHEATHRSLEDFSSAGQRLYFAEKSLQLIQERPVMGWGTGAYHEQYCRIADTEEWCRLGSVHPHNQFLFIAVDHGMVGLLLMVLFAFAPIWLTRNGTPEQRGIAAAFTGIFVITSLTHGSLWLSTESHFSTLMAALILAMHRSERRS
jgi:O-antigen ligase